MKRTERTRMLPTNNVATSSQAIPVRSIAPVAPSALLRMLLPEATPCAGK